MVAQAYFEDRPIVRVFDKNGKMIADLPMENPPSEKTADEALKRIKLRRRGKWNDSVCWAGREANIRFVR